jgi:hypothetical protein
MYEELDYHEYIITRHGLQAQPKKVEAIQRTQQHQMLRQLRRFLGMINYYRDMWKRQAIS